MNTENKWFTDLWTFKLQSPILSALAPLCFAGAYLMISEQEQQTNLSVTVQTMKLESRARSQRP